MIIYMLTWASANCSFLRIRAVEGLEAQDEQVQLSRVFFCISNTESEDAIGDFLQL